MSAFLRNKFNQVSGISNFTRNIGVSSLNNFITRRGQIHRTAHTNHANPFFERCGANMHIGPNLTSQQLAFRCKLSNFS